MLPRLGVTCGNKITIEIMSRPKGEYLTDEYFALDLPVAPAIMVGDEIVIEGKDVDDHTTRSRRPSAVCWVCRSPSPPKRVSWGGFLTNNSGQTLRVSR